MKKIIYILLLFLSMYAMYYFSSQDGTTSSLQSNIIVELIDDIRDKVTLKDERLINIKDKIKNELQGYNKNYIVRKAAHFSIYACIGGCMMIVIYLFTKMVILSGALSFILTFIYALYDENRQLLVDGRQSSFTDVIIDSSGAITAIVILTIILLIGKSMKFAFKRTKNIESEI
ncbi:MAG: VanZ family protein [Peptostreptococcaceae bacterium]